MKQYLEELEESVDGAFIENKQLMVMGNLNIDYITLTEEECLDIVLFSYNLSVCNSSIPARVTAQISSLFDYNIADSAIKNIQDCTFVYDTLAKSDHKATLSVFISKIPNVCKRITRKFASKTTVRRSLVP